MNLNALVSPVVAAVTPRELVQVFRNVGQDNVRGVVTPRYEALPPDAVGIYPASPKDLELVNRVGMNTVTLSFFFNGIVRGLDRPHLTGGDLIFARDEWWLVCAVPDDYTQAGWCRVLGCLQVTGGPNG